MKTFLIIVWIIIGYVIGSIPWALVIGKVFFNKDIRNYGSGNLGGSNAARVLGFPIGALVILLDGLKAFLTMLVCNNIYPDATLFVGLAACIGHCYPLFANFKGGKAVATTYGYLLGIGVFITHDVIFSFIFPVLMFFIILGLTKIVSISSMGAMVFETIVAFLTFKNNLAAYIVLFLTLFIIYRHRSNIVRLIKKEEAKVGFLA